MTTITRDKPKGFLAPSMHDQFAAELTAATGVVCRGAVVNDTPAADPVNDDRLAILFDGAPVEATVDAAIAAFPSITAGVTGTFAVTAGTEYVLREEIVQEGETIVFDVHVHAAFGTADAFSASYADWYAIANRLTGGNVKASFAGAVSLGNIPGYKISVVATATTAKIVMTIQRDGTLTIIMNDVEIDSRGKAPAP